MDTWITDAAVHLAARNSLCMDNLFVRVHMHSSPETVCAWTIYLRVHMHSSSKMKLEHSHILRFVLVLVRGLCSSGHDLVSLHGVGQGYGTYCFQIGAISLIGNSTCTGHAKDLSTVMSPKALCTICLTGGLTSTVPCE